MPANIEDDIVMTTPNNIPDPELIEDEDLNNIPLKNRPTFDIAETEPIVTLKDGETPLVFNDNYDLRGININE